MACYGAVREVKLSVLFSKQPDDLRESSIYVNVIEENILCGITSQKIYSDTINEYYLVYIDAGISCIMVSAYIPEVELCKVIYEEAQWIRRRSLDMSDDINDVKVTPQPKSRLFHCLCTFPANTRRRIRRCK